MKSNHIKRIGLLCAVILVSSQFFTCTSAGSGQPAASAGTVKVQFNQTYQTIDGFGGSNAWSRLTGVDDRAVELLFSQTNGIGLTILRNRIPFRDRLAEDEHPEYDDHFVKRDNNNLYIYTESDGIKTFELNWDSWDLEGTRDLIRKINALDGAPEKLTMMSSPWTPPNNRAVRWKPDVKDWTKPDVGGHLDPVRYADYGDLLADYAKGFEANMGIPLDILSVQNEPNWEPDYESCKWNAEELRDFIKVLGQRLQLKGVTVQVMAPEDENMKEDMVKPILEDPEAAAVLSIIGLHQYEGAYDASGKAGAEPMPTVWASGKRLWETEVSGSGPKMPLGDGIENALFYGKMIHYDMTLTRTNAFLYWWLWQKHDKKSNPGSLIQINNGAVLPSKRLYVLGQYSRFIRPGWVCVESDTEPAPGLYSSAYRSEDSSQFAVVLVNTSEEARSVDLALNGVKASVFEIYRTSEEEDLKQISKGKKLGSVYLAPQSVTTVYGY